jgi:hypothetical protein
LIEIPRALARQFRALLRRLVAPGGPRGPCPIVSIHAGHEGLTIQAELEEAAVCYRHPGSFSAGSIAFTADALAAFEGRDDTPVTLEQVAKKEGRACWSEAGVVRNEAFAIPNVKGLPTYPELLRKLTPAGEGFLAAMSEAVQTAAREAARPSLTRILLRGRTGEVIATDGRQLMVQRGFTFPWQEDVLVPALPVFANKGLPVEESVGIGRTADHVAIGVGSWTFALKIDKDARFPEYRDVLPRQRSSSCRLLLDPEDAGVLLNALPKMPGANEHSAPITLDLGPVISVRARSEEGGPVSEVVLPRSRAEGPPLRVVTNRRYLLRAVKLGFTEVRVARPDVPLLCQDDRRIYLWMPLDDKTALLPSSPSAGIAVTEQSALSNVARQPPTPETERSALMPAPPPDGNGLSNRPMPVPEQQPTACGIDELITEAEVLRNSLADAYGRIGRLVSALKRQRRQGRALEAALASLRQLQPAQR